MKTLDEILKMVDIVCNRRYLAGELGYRRTHDYSFDGVFNQEIKKAYESEEMLKAAIMELYNDKSK